MKHDDITHLFRYPEEMELHNRLCESLSAPALLKLLDRSEADVSGLAKQRITSSIPVNGGFPELSVLFNDVCMRLGMGQEAVECFITGNGMEARSEILFQKSGLKVAVFLGEEIVHRLEDDELRAVIGHELAHVKYEHYLLYVCADLIDIFKKRPRLLAVKNLYEHWRQLAEISADRLSLLAVDQPESVVSALYKQRLRRLHNRFDVYSHIRAQQAFLDGNHFNEFCDQSHPPLDFRAKAIIDFSGSSFFKAIRNGVDPGQDDSLENVQLLTTKLKIAPGNQPIALELLFLTVAGHYIVNCDECASYQEVRRLRDILARLIHDPGNMLFLPSTIEDCRMMMAQIGSAICDRYPASRQNILELLCSLVLQDGRISGQEIEALEDIAKTLGLNKRETSLILFKTIREDFYPVAD